MAKNICTTKFAGVIHNVNAGPRGRTIRAKKPERAAAPTEPDADDVGSRAGRTRNLHDVYNKRSGQGMR